MGPGENNSNRLYTVSDAIFACGANTQKLQSMYGENGESYAGLTSHGKFDTRLNNLQITFEENNLVSPQNRKIAGKF